MPRKQRPSDDPEERQRDFVRKREEHQAALDQNSIDLHDGRIPTFGEGALAVMARRVDEARAAVEEIGPTVPMHHVSEVRKPSLR